MEVGEKQAAVDLDIVADYGVSIADLASGIRRNVIAAVERMTGLEVTEVNINVNDVHLDDGSDDDDRPDPPHASSPHNKPQEDPRDRQQVKRRQVTEQADRIVQVVLAVPGVAPCTPACSARWLPTYRAAGSRECESEPT